MSIDWSKAPEGALNLVQLNNGKIAWHDRKGFISYGDTWFKLRKKYRPYTVIATRPTEKGKTVDDAVDELGERIDLLYNYPFYTSDGWVFSDKYRNQGFVCTREEFERAAAERKEQEWTHKYGRTICKIIVSKPDSCNYIIIEDDRGEYFLCTPEDLKPIKPAITQSQADAVKQCAVEMGFIGVDKWLAEREVVG